MHIFACLDKDFFKTPEDEERFIASLKAACGAEVSRTEGCPNDTRSIVLTVYDIPIEDGEHRPDGIHSAFGQIAQHANELLGNMVNEITVLDPSDQNHRYRIAVGSAAVA